MKRSVEGRKALVCGMGLSGVAAALLLKERGAEVKASDVRGDADVMENSHLLQNSGIGCEIGDQAGELLHEVDLLVLSPGVEGDAAIVNAARERSIDIIGEIELAYWFWNGGIIAVSGTNGKTTAAHMIKAILDTAGRRSVLAGNLGYPFSRAVLQDGEAELVVLEVSSFQLEHICFFHPHVAVLLNLAPDHLDRYDNVREYYDFKLLIFSNQGGGDYAIYRWDEADYVQPLTSRTGATEITFGLNEGRLTTSGEAVIEDGERVLSLTGFDLPGSHNIENALAATAVGIACGIENETIEKSLRSFRGLPHRIEFVGTYHGVAFYNDSKATNLDAMLKALCSLTAPILLIAGGKDKGENFASVREVISARAKAVLLIGESGPAMREALSGCSEVATCSSLDEAVVRAVERADMGDIILLSPGCSSLDMYKSFKERGDHFKKIIKNLRGVNDE